MCDFIFCNKECFLGIQFLMFSHNGVSRSNTEISCLHFYWNKIGSFYASCKHFFRAWLQWVKEGSY